MNLLGSPAKLGAGRLESEILQKKTKRNFLLTIRPVKALRSFLLFSFEIYWKSGRQLKAGEITVLNKRPSHSPWPT